MTTAASTSLERAIEACRLARAEIGAFRQELAALRAPIVRPPALRVLPGGLQTLEHDDERNGDEHG